MDPTLNAPEECPMAHIFVEELHKGFAQTHSIEGTTLVDERSEFQHIMIYDAPAVGRVLVLDHIVQLTTRDECGYSEMLAHLPYFELKAKGITAARALVIGGGDGAVAEEFLKHPSMSQVDMAEIDPRVIAVCKEHLQEAHKGAFDNPRLKVRVTDGAAFIRTPSSVGAFDIIAADRPDPVGPAKVLFADEFYASVSKALKPHGLALFQTGVPHFQQLELSETLPQLKRAFRHAGVALSVVPTYVGGFMALTWGSNDTKLGEAPLEALAKAYQASGIKTDYYNPEIHKAAMALPNWMKRLMPA
jgi:spermidine synthase